MIEPLGGWAPGVRLASRIRGLNGWRRWVLAIVAGGLAATALPPADILPAFWVAIPILVWLLDGARSWKAGFWLGWCFGFGYFAISLYWLTISLFVDIARYWWLVPFASNGLAAGLAIFWGLATMLAARVPYQRPFLRIAALVATWSFTEWLRGHILTGFPWNLPGYAWTDTPMIQVAAFVGIYGVTVLALGAPALASLLGSPFVSRHRAKSAALAGPALVALIGIAGVLRVPSDRMPTVEGVRLRVVQPSIPEKLRANRDLLDERIRQHIMLTRLPATQPPNVVVWSEDAEPYPLDTNPELAKVLGSILPPDGFLLTGTTRIVPEEGVPTYRNSIAAIDAKGQVAAWYDKAHLVPFGEYMPLRRWLPLDAVATGAIDMSPGAGVRSVKLPGLPPVSPLICYEAIFPRAVVDRANRPEWMLGVTDDAWFGLSAGPHQDFSMARVRTIEEGLPMVRAANHGVSAVIDPYGRIIKQLGLGEVGIIDSELPKSIPPTLYSTIGDVGFFIMTALLALAVLLYTRRPLRAEIVQASS